MKTEAGNPSVRLPHIPFHLVDPPGVTVKSKRRVYVYQSTTVCSRTSTRSGWRDPIKQLGRVDWPIDSKNINSTTEKSITLHSTANCNIPAGLT